MILKYSPHICQVVSPSEMEIGQTGTIIVCRGWAFQAGKKVEMVPCTWNRSKRKLNYLGKSTGWSKVDEYTDVSTFAIELD